MTPNTYLTFYRVARQHLHAARHYRDAAHDVRKCRTQEERLHCLDQSAGWYRSAMQYRALARGIQAGVK